VEVLEMGKEIKMRRPFAVSAMAAVLSIFVAGEIAQAQQQAGVSAAVRGQVALSRASQNIVGKKVGSGEAIFLGDAITSGKNSGMQVMLLDETIFTIGPNSAMSIDEFVYDPSTSAGKVAASVTKGVFRFITGKIARKRPEDMTVRLPTATIGIRGTIVAGAVRSGAGDEAVDKLFEGLRGKAPGAENARDFVVLLGPGNENNTNDKGGEFVYTPGGVQKAAIGQNAGSSLAQAPGAGGAGSGSVTVSRAGWGAASDGAGNIFGPFTVPVVLTQGLTAPLSAQPASGSTGKPGDATSKDANSFSGQTANQLSGNVVASTLNTLLDATTPPPTAPPELDTTVEGTQPVPIADVLANFSSFNHAQASFNVDNNNISYSFSMTIHFEDEFVQAQFSSIQVNNVHDFGSAFGQTDFSDLPGGLASDSGLPDSVSGGSDGNCSQCTLSAAMFTSDTVTAGLTFDHGTASVGSAFDGVTSSGTGAVTGFNSP
jgi:hypothetical protein